MLLCQGPKGTELAAKANENLFNTLVLHPLEILPHLIICCTHKSTNELWFFLVALHVLREQLVAVDHKPMNTHWRMECWVNCSEWIFEVCAVLYIYFVTRCTLGGWCDCEVPVLHLCMCLHAYTCTLSMKSGLVWGWSNCKSEWCPPGHKV